MLGLTFEQARPLVEARLYAWGDLLGSGFNDPVAATSRISDMPKAIPAISDSQEERWVLKRCEAWEDKPLLDRLLLAIGRDEQRLIKLHYHKRMSWSKVAAQMNMGRRSVYSIRDRALYVFACHMGLLD